MVFRYCNHRSPNRCELVNESHVDILGGDISNIITGWLLKNWQGGFSFETNMQIVGTVNQSLRRRSKFDWLSLSQSKSVSGPLTFVCAARAIPFYKRRRFLLELF